MHGEPIITLKNVGVSYAQRAGILRHKRFWALEDVSLDLYHGESLGVIGRNGAGKSSLLRVLAGITAPDRGTVVNNGFRVTMLSLQVGFNPKLTGLENVYLSGLLMGLSRREISASLGNIMEFSELGDFFYEPIGTYSAGMRIRLGFSIAVEANPDVLLIDEVLGVGDANFKKKSSRRLQELMASDKTVVLVSHQVDTMKKLCTRAVYIKDRRTVASGPPKQVIQAYLGDAQSQQPVRTKERQ